MVIDTVTPRSRRALLAAAAGSLAALAAQAVGRPSPARGANLDPVKLGTNNTETTRTLIENTTDGRTVLWARATGSGKALLGTTDSGAGLYAYSGSGPGVHGNSGARTGVYGFSGSGAAPTLIPGKTGVYGRCDVEHGVGVYGRAADGIGVLGVLGDPPGAYSLSHTAAAVYGYSVDGMGVYGYSENFRAVNAWCPNGIAVEATSQNGTALVVEGKVTFTTAGLSTIPSGTDHVVVTPGVGIDGSSKVLCTLHGSPGGATSIQRVTRQVDADTFTIYTTADVNADCGVSWFVIS
jgi:hypothetical protein